MTSNWSPPSPHLNCCRGYKQSHRCHWNCFDPSCKTTVQRCRHCHCPDQRIAKYRRTQLHPSIAPFAGVPIHSSPRMDTPRTHRSLGRRCRWWMCIRSLDRHESLPTGSHLWVHQSMGSLIGAPRLRICRQYQTGSWMCSCWLKGVLYLWNLLSP